MFRKLRAIHTIITGEWCDAEDAKLGESVVSRCESEKRKAKNIMKSLKMAQ